jgi:hypothetical protein
LGGVVELLFPTTFG